MRKTYVNDEYLSIVNASYIDAYYSLLGQLNLVICFALFFINKWIYYIKEYTGCYFICYSFKDNCVLFKIIYGACLCIY